MQSLATAPSARATGRPGRPACTRLAPRLARVTPRRCAAGPSAATVSSRSRAAAPLRPHRCVVARAEGNGSSGADAGGPGTNGGGSSGPRGGGGGGGGGGGSVGASNPGSGGGGGGELPQALLAAALLAGVPAASWAALTRGGSAKGDAGAPAAPSAAGGAAEKRAAPATGVATKEDIMTLKRLLREVFADQVTIKSRLGSVEAAASAQLEPGDAFDASIAAGGWDGGLSTHAGGAAGLLPFRSALRATGVAHAGASLVFAAGGGAGADDAVATAERLGGGAGAGAAVWLHSILQGDGAPGITVANAVAPPPAAAAAADATPLGGADAEATRLRPAAGGASVQQGPRQRLTAKLVQSAGGNAGSLQLEQLLYRTEINKRLRLLLAPLGGRLSDAAPCANPHAPLFYGITPFFRAGHGVGISDAATPSDPTGAGPGGSGAAFSFGAGAVSASVGHFCRPAGGEDDSSGALRHSSAAQISLRARDGVTLTVITSASSVLGGSGKAGGNAASGPRFEGLRLPAAAAAAGGSAGAESPTTDGARVGVVAAAPLGDAFVASAWAEGRTAGSSTAAGGWGVGLHTQPDAGGQAIGLALARPPGEGAPLLCELSARLPVADGLELTPGALVVRGAGGGAAAALRLGGNWRF